LGHVAGFGDVLGNGRIISTIGAIGPQGVGAGGIFSPIGAEAIGGLKIAGERIGRRGVTVARGLRHVWGRWRRAGHEHQTKAEAHEGTYRRRTEFERRITLFLLSSFHEFPQA
jgi:hypothetical protein